MKNTRMILWVIGLAVAALLVALIAWFWSLGSVQASELPHVRVEPVKTPAEWRRGGEGEWSAISVPVDVLPGDQIRTGQGGEAKLVWGDRGYTRIEENSQLTIEASPVEGIATPGAKIQLKLESGRVWSRMLKLLDLDSTIEVKTSDVVATVRGTTFGVGKDADGTQIAVSESVVGMRGAGDGETLLRDNQWGKFGPDGKAREVRDLRPDDAWAESNRKKDADDDKVRFNDLRNRFERKAATFEGAPRFMVDASETLRLRFSSGKTREKLAKAYAERRLAAGDEKAFRRYANQAGAERRELLGLAHALGTKQARTFRMALIDPGNARKAYLDAVDIDDRIDDLIQRPVLDRTSIEIGELRAVVDAFDRRIAQLEVSEAERTGLGRKAQALRKRLEVIGEALPSATPIEVPQPTQGTQIPDVAKPTPTVIKPAPTTQSTVTTYQRYTLLPSNSQPSVGQPVRLSMFGTTASGQTDDLTAKTIFSVAMGGQGSLSGNVFTPSVAGTIKLNGVFTDPGGAHAASASITVKTVTQTPVTGYQSLSIVFSGATTLACSGRSTFKVYANYGDGTRKDVTLMSSISVSDPKLIYANNDGVLMSFCAAIETTATLNATYREGQISKSASATITVTPEPKPVTVPCTGRNC